MSTDRISIQILEDFVKRVRTASKSSQKQITIPIGDAENIVYHLNLTTLKLLDKYQEALAKKEAEVEVITVSMDGGGFEEKR
jgi:hypothetical protein